MPYSFRFTVHKISSDDCQQTTLVLKVDHQDYDRVNPLGKLTRQVLIATVFTEDESALLAQGGTHERHDDDF